MTGALNGPSPTLATQERKLAHSKLLSPWLFFSAAGPSFEDWRSKYIMKVEISCRVLN
jgi:hypothetical protein